MRTRPHNAPGGMPYTPQEQPTARDEENGAALQEKEKKQNEPPLLYLSPAFPPGTPQGEQRFCGLLWRGNGEARRRTEGESQRGKEGRKDDGSEGEKERNPIVTALEFP